MKIKTKDLSLIETHRLMLWIKVLGYDCYYDGRGNGDVDIEVCTKEGKFT